MDGQPGWTTLCTTSDKSDWNATYYAAIGGDALVHAPDDGWPDDVALSLTDVPEAALTCGFGAHAKLQLALSSEAALAVAWDDFRIEPWVRTMVLPAGKRLRCRSESLQTDLRFCVAGAGYVYKNDSQYHWTPENGRLSSVTHRHYN
jgi:hypothetical protein